jgi:hypothetical protein
MELEGHPRANQSRSRSRDCGLGGMHRHMRPIEVSRTGVAAMSRGPDPT